MRTRTAIATAVATTAIGGLLLTSGAVAVASNGSQIRNPSTVGMNAGRGAAGTGAGMGTGTGTCTGTGTGWGAGMGGGGSVLPASGTLTAQQKTTLAAMAEEEKLAHDVYVALAASTSDVRFTRVATAEQRHLDAVRTLMVRYQITDPTADKAAGAFTSPSVTQQYTQLVAQGKTSLSAALEVGRKIESQDIADLRAASQDLKAADVTAVYAHLSAASAQHLRIFGG
jgi:hypothetical protein